jgi:protoporphyrinogen oxidase
MYDAIVIGGGLSGAVFAHHFAKKGKVLIIEKEQRLGGAIHTVFPFGGSFFAELGAHTIYRSYGTIIKIIGEIFPPAAILPHKNPGYFIKYNGKITSVFSQLNFWGLLKGVAKLPFHAREGKSVREFYSVFGANYERVIAPALSAVICQDAAEVAADVIMKSRRTRAKGYPRAFTLAGGLSALIDKIALQENITVSFSAKAERIIKDSGGYTVVTATGGKHRAKHLAVATDISAAARLLELEWTGETAKILNSFPTVFSNAFLFAAKKNDYTFPPFGYIISRDGDFRGMVSRDPVYDGRFRAATLHFSEGVEPAETFSKLKGLFGINGDIYTQTERFSLPRLTPGHKARVERLEEIVAGIKNLHLLGNYFGGLSMEDCAIRAEKETQNV